MWLTVDNIEEKDGQVINEVPDIVGSGQSVGGVVSQTVGAMDEGDDELQVKCKFFFSQINIFFLTLSRPLDVPVRPTARSRLWSFV